jgi:hypothetical protein
MPEDTPLRRACDRCHNIKERCQWLSGSDICQRCLRLGHDCQTLRPVQKLGRKPRSRTIRTIPFYGASSTQPLGGLSNDSPENAQSSTETDSNIASPPDTASTQRQTTEELSRIFQESPGLSEAEREILGICFGSVEASGMIAIPGKSVPANLSQHNCLTRPALADTLQANSPSDLPFTLNITSTCCRDSDRRSQSSKTAFSLVASLWRSTRDSPYRHVPEK